MAAVRIKARHTRLRVRTSETAPHWSLVVALGTLSIQAKLHSPRVQVKHRWEGVNKLQPSPNIFLGSALNILSLYISMLLNKVLGRKTCTQTNPPNAKVDNALNIWEENQVYLTRTHYRWLASVALRAVKAQNILVEVVGRGTLVISLVWRMKGYRGNVGKALHKTSHSGFAVSVPAGPGS
ncbi:hypothetical protein DFP72DRAFT_855615 [Ephemerocybe angulata]|uniref:Uncharacterized protein n=1 Tax=Ephemerocybe angulata TaxID=980116 RepID=A0A8H6LW75_9AGAR|nr:hypothetical protein DFP72DRAFT_855615 [Tulosesus angulatus]